MCVCVCLCVCVGVCVERQKERRGGGRKEYGNKVYIMISPTTKGIILEEVKKHFSIYCRHSEK